MRLPVPVSGEGVVQWDGRLPAGHRLRPGDTLVYLVRAYGRGGQAERGLHALMLAAALARPTAQAPIFRARSSGP